ncbi:hypothetical protein E5288_WYG013390 [Bos mutus]|uniref:C2H2-type domain-containing protein n=1 Tax=Bos mutus TaxID=72004 RepID=A0A6B0S8L0_9CETA|nr:hypothetical protein [Bos mutus]
MGIQAPTELLELVDQSLLQKEALAIVALEELPIELFLLLFMVAFARRHTQALNSMAWVWPFPCLPLETLMKDHQPHLETFQAALDSLDVLLAQKVLVDLCLKEDTLDRTLCHLLKKAKQRRSLLHLGYQKLRIFTRPMQSIRGILKLVQLDSIQDLEVNCTWKLAMLGRFVPHLGQMGNLCWLLLWHIHVLPHTAPNQEEHCELYLDSISFLNGRLHQVLRFLKIPLETLSIITNCLISDFCGNPISMAMLESLLHHTMGLSKLSHVLYPAALESYEDVCSTLHLGLLAQLHTWLKQLLCIFHTVTTQQSTPDSVHTSLSHVQNGEPCPTAFPKGKVHCKPISPLGENGLTKTDFPSVASQNKIAGPTEGNLIVLLHDFYYGKHIGDGQPEPKTHTAFKCLSCLKVLKNVKFMNHIKHHLELERQRGDSLKYHTA